VTVPRTAWHRGDHFCAACVAEHLGKFEFSKMIAPLFSIASQPSVHDTYDVVIVGGGPAGLSAALVLARACREVLVIDAGQPRNASARHVHGFLSRDGVDPHELLAQGRGELRKYGVSFLSDEAVGCSRLLEPCVRTRPTQFKVATHSGQHFTCRKLLLATGTVDELPQFPGVKECYGVSVHHCPYCDGWEHRGQRLLAYGDTAEKAVGLGIALRTWSEKVTVLTNGAPVEESDLLRLAANDISLNSARICKINRREDGQCVGVELENADVIPADALFFNTRQRPRSDLPRLLGCALDEDGLVCTHGRQHSDIPGLFLAGDADGDVQFAIVAAAEGARAAVAINRELQDEDREHCANTELRELQIE
jgi:thioredoxin reductase